MTLTHPSGDDGQVLAADDLLPILIFVISQSRAAWLPAAIVLLMEAYHANSKVALALAR